MMKKIFISGVCGQDGSILARLLLENGCEVVGGFRKNSSQLWRLEKLGILEHIRLYDLGTSILDRYKQLLDSTNFEEIYLLSGFSSTEKSRIYPQTATEKILYEPLAMIMESITKEQKIFIAGSSEIFAATTKETRLFEDSTVGPRSPYGYLHLAMKGICESLIETQAPIFYGILFNHESELRDTHFLTSKILDGFLKMTQDKLHTIRLGNFESRRDFGLAEDFVNAMYSLMQTKEFGSYNFATGKTHSVLEIVIEFSYQFGFRPIFIPEVSKVYDETSNRVLVEFETVVPRKDDSNSNPGDSSKLSKVVGFDLHTSLQSLVSRIIKPSWVSQ
jgi:GDPmannose 4,6-dehydratase